MKITVVAHPKSSVEKVVKVTEESFEVYFSVPLEKGKANKKILDLVAAYFDVPKSSVALCSGQKSRQKVIEISD